MLLLGRGCGTAGRAVTSDFRDPWFESQHRQSFSKISVRICQLQFRKAENKEKEAGIGQFSLKKLMFLSPSVRTLNNLRLKGSQDFFSAILQLKSEKLRLITVPIAPQAKNLTNFFN